MRSLDLKTTHKPVQTYYAALRHFDDLGVSHEGEVKSAFRSLPTSTGERVRCRSWSGARQHDWTERISKCECRMEARCFPKPDQCGTRTSSFRLSQPAAASVPTSPPPPSRKCASNTCTPNGCSAQSLCFYVIVSIRTNSGRVESRLQAGR